MFNENSKNNGRKIDFVAATLFVTALFFTAVILLSTVAAVYGLFYPFPSWFPLPKPSIAELLLILCGSFLALVILFLIWLLTFDKSAKKHDDSIS